MRKPLIPHLRRDLCLGRRFTNDSSFPDTVGERLFAVDMLAKLKGRQSCECVGMFAGADNDGIELIRVVKHLAKVDDRFCFGMCCRGPIQIPLIHIAQCDNIFGPGHGTQVCTPAPPCSDHGLT